MEQNLGEDLSVAALARACYCSESCMHKLFGYAFGFRAGEYIQKRRLCAAARELVNTGRSVTDVACDYRYGSPEAFSRAFARFYGEPPSRFRKNRRFTELFPKFTLNIKEGEIGMTNRRSVDISMLYDELKKLSGSYVLCVDIIHFMEINDTYGYAAGDLVLARTAARIERHIAGDMLLFRVGKDEFAVATGLYDKEKAGALAARIMDDNGKTVEAGGKDVPLSLRVAVIRIPEGGLSYREVLDEMHRSLDELRAKES